MAQQEGSFGLAVADITTGFFQVTQFSGEKPKALLLDELARLSPAEVLIAADGIDGCLPGEMKARIDTTVSVLDASFFDPEAAKKRVKTLPAAGKKSACFDHMPLALPAAGALLAYITDTQKAN